MGRIFNDEISQQLKDIYKGMIDEVKIVLFLCDEPCESCPDIRDFLEETAQLTDKVKLEIKSFEKDKEDAARYGVTLAPSFVMLDKDGNYKGVKFNGFPGGHEINSFIYALLNMSGKLEELPEKILKRVASYDKKVNIKVFTTPG